MFINTVAFNCKYSAKLKTPIFSLSKNDNLSYLLFLRKVLPLSFSPLLCTKNVFIFSVVGLIYNDKII